MQVTREAFSRYMRVIKRALTDAAAKESARAAAVALATPQEPASAEQTAGEATTKNRKEQTTPFSVNVTRSQVSYQAAQGLQLLFAVQFSIWQRLPLTIVQRRLSYEGLT